MDGNLQFCWFVCLGIDDAVWGEARRRRPTVFTKNRGRLSATEMSHKVMTALLAHPRVKPLLSDEYVSVDGTRVMERASMRSFQSKDR
ncbi:hypothetical protein JSE7799_02267 [Jannaschia seosinensis]|uniref:Transposase InsH N-terminal domain-containing protein n=1 Tax=Jannaschia seosinensis TaxID=313367 RepID=A0A0M7B9Y0_9RHOB|nr:hypothetical protein JSE7799_02267 [Jannaschia seosinensis]